MHYATESSRTRALDILSQHGFDIHAVDHGGRSVLHHAALRGNLAAVKRALELGAKSDISALDCRRMTPCELASACGAVDVASYLMSLDRVDEPSTVVPLSNEAKAEAGLKLLLGFRTLRRLRFQTRLLVPLGLVVWYMVRHSWWLAWSL